MASDFNKDDPMSAPAPKSSLGDLLEKLASKYPDDEDVAAAVDEFSMEPSEDIEEDFEDDMDFEEAPPEEAASEAVDFEAMFSEDMEMEDEEEMPPTKKKKPAPKY